MRGDGERECVPREEGLVEVLVTVTAEGFDFGGENAERNPAIK